MVYDGIAGRNYHRPSPQELSNRSAATCPKGGFLQGLPWEVGEYRNFVGCWRTRFIEDAVSEKHWVFSMSRCQAPLQLKSQHCLKGLDG